MSAVDTVEAEVRELVRRRGLDPVRDRQAVRRLVDEVLADYDERSLTSNLMPVTDRSAAVRQVYDAVAGFGPLQRHLDDPTVEEVWINEPGRVFVARHGRSELTTTILSEGEVRDLVEKMLRTSGRRLDLSTPFVDAQLPDGSRLHVVIPELASAAIATRSAYQEQRADQALPAGPYLGRAGPHEPVTAQGRPRDGRGGPMTATG